MLPKFAEWINGAVHESTGLAPIEIQLGRRPRDAVQDFLRQPSDGPVEVDWGQVHTHLTLAAEKRNKDARRQRVFFNPGDYVLVKANPSSSAIDAVTRKFFFVYEGPFVVTKVLRPDVFVLKNPKNGKERGFFHISLLKPFRGQMGEQDEQTQSDRDRHCVC